MSLPIVVAFCGRAGSGKTTAAQHLVDKWGAKRVSFAGPLKYLAKLLFDLTEEQVRGTQSQKETIDPRYGVSPRTLMIRLGDSAREIIDPCIWIRACFNVINKDTASYPKPKTRPLYVIDDARYQNEINELLNEKRFKGMSIKLVCPDSDSTGEYANAPSEVSVDQIPEHLFCEVITSSKSLGSTDLKAKVDMVVARMLGT